MQICRFNFWNKYTDILTLYILCDDHSILNVNEPIWVNPNTNWGGEVAYIALAFDLIVQRKKWVWLDKNNIIIFYFPLIKPKRMLYLLMYFNFNGLKKKKNLIHLITSIDLEIYFFSFLRKIFFTWPQPPPRPPPPRKKH